MAKNKGSIRKCYRLRHDPIFALSWLRKVTSSGLENDISSPRIAEPMSNVTWPRNVDFELIKPVGLLVLFAGALFHVVANSSQDSSAKPSTSPYMLNVLAEGEGYGHE